MIRGTPAEMGFARAPKFDEFLKKRAGWEVWVNRQEGLLLALPPGCESIGLQEVVTARGTTLACLEPEGVVSVWPFKRGAKHGESED